jgi:carbon starvation protein
MTALVLMIIVFSGYILMYRIYGKYISKRIFKLNKNQITPSVKFQDGVDYQPTRKEVIFGHHFASIAGTGPIVGPAIAVIWGWVPAILWIFFGSIFIGAVHDFGILIISMRNQGKSIADIAGKYINRRIRILFFIIVFLELWILIAVFGLVIAIIFKMFPGAVFPVWIQIPIAILLGYFINGKDKNIWLWSIYALIAMYLSIIAGYFFPFTMPEIAGIPSTGIWTVLLLIYAFVASVLPVKTLLQPRDFINTYQLVLAMLLIVIGVIASSFNGTLSMAAPAFRLHVAEAPSVWPFLFIVIACGAISGFHSLVASGTSSKQIINEKDSLFVGYGGMLTEGMLATLVLIAVAAGIGMGYKDSNGEVLSGFQAWSGHYSSWNAAQGLGSKLSAFVQGSANMIESIKIPPGISVVIMGVFVASFAGTTLDTGTRVQRYVLMEIFEGTKTSLFKNRYFTTALAVISAMVLAFITGVDGKGALMLWPLFGVVNQILATITLLVISLYLKSKGGWKWIISGLPAVFMAFNILWATLENQIIFSTKNNTFLMVINALILLIAIWIIIEGFLSFIRKTKNTKI